MRVKIGDTWYSSEDTPICIQISKKEKILISTMDMSGNKKFAVYPTSTILETLGLDQKEAIKDWMKEDSDK